MCFVVPLCLELMIAHRASDRLQLGSHNVSCAITATSCSNAILPLRITYEVARVDPSMYGNRISVYDTFSFFPSVALTVEEIHLGRLSTSLTCRYVFSTSNEYPFSRHKLIRRPRKACQEICNNPLLNEPFFARPLLYSLEGHEESGWAAALWQCPLCSLQRLSCLPCLLL